MAVLPFDVFWRDHGAKAGLRGLSKEAQEAARRQDEFRAKAQLAGAVVGAALFKLGKDSVAVASSTNEAQSKVQVVYGKSATVITRFAESSAKSLGLSKLAALDAAGTLGNLFVALKLPQAEAAKMSTKMITLASDLASFNDADPTEVLEALRSGLVGETEPLRKFGVNLNEAAIKAEAMRLGLVKATGDTAKIQLAQERAALAQTAYTKAVKQHGEQSDQAKRALVTLHAAQNTLNKAVQGTVPDLTAAEKAQASYSLILGQTKTAQGDFARTSDSLANRQRELRAQFSNLQGELGEKLLPAAVKVAGALSDLLTFIGDHGQAVAITAGAVGTLAAAVAGLNAASTAVDSWRNLAGSLTRVKDAAGTKTTGAAGALGRVGSLIGAGGPWGLAAAGAVTVIGALAVEHQKAKARVDDLRKSLDKETGAFTKSTERAVANALAKSGAFEAGKALGINVRDLTQAALGNEKAEKRVNQALKEAADRYKALSPEQRISSEWARELEGRTSKVHDALGDQNKELAKAKRAWGADQAAKADVTEATKDATRATRDNKAAIAETRRELARLPKYKGVTVGAAVKFPTGWAQYRAGERKAFAGPIGDGVGSVDDVPILAMRGEHMWTTKEVQAAGGHSAVKRIRNAALAGQLQGYAKGGPIGVATTPSGVRRGFEHIESMLEDAAVQWGRHLQKQLDVLGGGAIGGGWRSQWAAVHKAFPWAQLTSAYRPGSVTASGNRSYHSMGRAIDVSPSMDIFRWIARNYGGRTKELIFSTAGTDQIKNGRKHWYGEPVRSMHWNHVHWAYDQGGMANGPGWMAKATSRPERVLSPRQTASFENLVRVLDRGDGGRPVNVTVVFPNYIGDRNDLRAALRDFGQSGELDRFIGRR